MPEVTEQLLEVLTSLDEASQFCTSGSLASILPGLEVQGVGEVGLPIGPAAARQLIQQAAPEMAFGAESGELALAVFARACFRLGGRSSL